MEKKCMYAIIKKIWEYYYGTVYEDKKIEIVFPTKEMAEEYLEKNGEALAIRAAREKNFYILACRRYDDPDNFGEEDFLDNIDDYGYADSDLGADVNFAVEEIEFQSCESVEDAEKNYFSSADLPSREEYFKARKKEFMEYEGDGEEPVAHAKERYDNDN